jgi:hypothetical protein
MAPIYFGYNSFSFCWVIRGLRLHRAKVETILLALVVTDYLMVVLERPYNEGVNATGGNDFVIGTERQTPDPAILVSM